MNPETPKPGSGILTSPQLPLLLLGSAFFFYFLLETGGLKQGQESLKFQIETLEKRTANFKTAKDKIEKNIADRKPMADTSEATQKLFTNMMQDLIDLGKKNEDAQAIVNTYRIRMNTPPEGMEEKAEEEAK